MEGLVKDFDLNILISREILEDLCNDLFQRSKKLIESTLNMAKLDLSEIHEVEIIGGVSRIPKFQQVLKDTLQRLKKRRKKKKEISNFY